VIGFDGAYRLPDTVDPCFRLELAEFARRARLAGFSIYLVLAVHGTMKGRVHRRAAQAALAIARKTARERPRRT
jgi:hypothetical protein